MRDLVWDEENLKDHELVLMSLRVPVRRTKQDLYCILPSWELAQSIVVSTSY